VELEAAEVTVIVPLWAYPSDAIERTTTSEVRNK